MKGIINLKDDFTMLIKKKKKYGHFVMSKLLNIFLIPTNYVQ